MASDQVLEGGPVWTERTFAFDHGCKLMQESNEVIGKLLPMWAGREGAVADETIRAWRRGFRAAPFWAYVGLWRRLRSQGLSAEYLFLALGYQLKED